MSIQSQIQSVPVSDIRGEELLSLFSLAGGEVEVL